MIKYVTDTHTLLWYLTNSPSLSRTAGSAFDDAKNGLAIVYIPAIVFAELYYLNVKHKYIKDFASDYQKIKQSGQYVVVPFESDDVLDFDMDSSVREMHDRMIVGVARRLNGSLITKDKNIAASSLVKVVW